MNLAWAMGLDLGGTGLKHGLVSEAGDLLCMHTIPSRAAEGPDAVVSQLRAALTILTHDAAERGISPCAVGLGCPGTVDPTAGTLSGALPNLPGMRGLPIVSLLGDLAGMPPVVDNDANVMALAEALVGAGRGLDSVLGVTIGTGIGAGLVLRGEIYRGEGAAGEIGHMRIEPDGRPCACGGAGCLEQYGAVPALSRAYRDITGESVDARAVIEYWILGGEAAMEAVDRWSGFLARGLAAVLTMLHPSCLVLGGGIMEGRATLLTFLDRRIRAHCLGVIADSVSIRAAERGPSAGVVGAGMSALGTHRRATGAG
jgi:glucokinase